MLENLILDSEQLFQEVVERGRREGVANQEAFHQMVENVVNDHLRDGEVDEDQDIGSLTLGLIGRWRDYQKEIE